MRRKLRRARAVAAIALAAARYAHQTRKATTPMTDATITRWRGELARRRVRGQAIRRRINRLKAAIARRKRRLAAATNPTRAVRWALDQVGVHEQPFGSNSGPKISDWIRAGGGVPGWAWCQYFANAVAVAGGCPQIKSGYTPFVLAGGAASLGYRRVPAADVRPGDFVYFKFPGVSNDACDHVGVYIGDGRTVEGNTSPGTAGSQNNGGGVYVRSRSRSLWAGVIRPPYQEV